MFSGKFSPSAALYFINKLPTSRFDSMKFPTPHVTGELTALIVPKRAALACSVKKHYICH